MICILPSILKLLWLYLVLLGVAKLHKAGHNIEEVSPGLLQLRGPEPFLPDQGTDGLGQYLNSTRTL